MANGNPSPNSTFDLERRLAKYREKKILIGGREFHPAKETTETRAAERKLGRERAKIAHELTEAAKHADETGDFDVLDELEQRQEETLYELAAMQLTDSQDQPPDAKWLAHNFPIGQLSELYEFLGPEEKPADPS